MTGNALIDLGELSKPATVLIEKISDAIGGIAKPWQIKRVASAQAEAEKITALAQIEVSEIQQRAITRMVREEGIKQQNIENITAGAIPHLAENADPSALEEDWLAHFFEKSRIVSNPDMQSLWSRILAGEANQSHSFSKRTIELVSTLSKDDAETFTALCSMVWHFGVIECVYKYNDDEFKRKFGSRLHFSNLRHLDSIGLVSFSSSAEGVFNFTNEATFITVYYYGIPIIIELHSSGSNKPLLHGHVSLTQAGKELAAISGAKPNYEYFEFILNGWLQTGHVISTPLAAKGQWIKLRAL